MLTTGVVGASKATTALIILDFATLYILGALIAIAHSFGLVSQADVLRGREEERLVTIAAKMRTDGMFNLRCARA